MEQWGYCCDMNISEFVYCLIDSGLYNAVCLDNGETIIQKVYCFFRILDVETFCFTHGLKQYSEIVLCCLHATVEQMGALCYFAV